MALEEKCYKSLLKKDCQGVLETFDLILPPLIKPQIGTNLNNYPWKRHFVAAIIILIIIVIIIAIGITILLCNRANLIDYNELEDGLKIYVGERPTNDDKDQRLKINYDFRKDIQHIYHSIIRQKKPKDLKSFFESCEKELSGLKNIEDFKYFLIVLLLENEFNCVNGRNEKINNQLTREDLNFTLLLSKKLKSWYFYLDEFKNNLTKYETQLHFRDFDERHNKRTFFSIPEIEMDEMKSREMNRTVKEWTRSLKINLTNSTVTFSKNVVLLSEVWERIKRNFELQKPYIYIFASKILYLDTDLYLPETNVAIIAPKWLFLKNVTIFLSGFDARDHENMNAERNVDGDAGYPGGDGGNFLGIGDFDRENLKIYSDGGKGGDGQNGANGLNGTEYRGYQSHLFEGPHLCARILEGIEQKNIHGETVSYYKVYNFKGCGQSGTNGGLAGEGGKGGEMVFINPEQAAVYLNSGQKGLKGRGGKGGKGGFGAKKGCYYLAYSTKQGKLERLTSIKCNVVEMPSGFDGKDNFSAGGMKKSNTTDDRNGFSNALQQFRSFVIDEYLSGDEEIMLFLNKIDELPYLSNITQFQDFIAEMALLETHERTEFYYSLGKRIDIILKSSPVDDDYKNLLIYLRTLLYGKIASLKYGLNKCIIVDLKTYFDKIINSLENVDVQLLRHEDHSLSTLTELLRGKIAYLSESFDHWIAKASNLLRIYNSSLRKEALKDERCLKRVSSQFDDRKMIYLTLIAAQVLKPLCSGMLNYLNDDIIPEENYMRMRKTLHEFETRRKRTNNELNIIIGNYYSAYNSSEIQLLSRMLIDTGDFVSNLVVFKAASVHSTVVNEHFQRHQNLMFKELEILSSGELTLADVKIHLNKLKTLMKILSSFISLKKNDSSFFPVNLEHFEITLDLIEILRERYYFLRYWSIVQFVRIENPDLIQKSKELRTSFLDIFITSQYREALNAFRQWVFPHMYIYSQYLPKNEKITLEEAKSGINLLKKWLEEYRSTIVTYDKYIRETIFSSNNSVGEYYRWKNIDIRADLEDLFRGKKIALTASVENFHIPTKNAIKFRTVRLEFQSKNANATNLLNILKNIEVEMKHSGYSYFYYNGKIYLHTSEEFDLHYSYELGSNGEPINYNMVYKKLMERPPIFSPFTTWVIQLRPVVAAGHLLQFVEDVDLVIVGSGSYLSAPNDNL